MNARKDWSPEDYRARFAELRGQLGELATMDSNSDEYRSRFGELKAERAIIEEEYHCVNRAQEESVSALRSAGFRLRLPP